MKQLGINKMDKEVLIYDERANNIDNSKNIGVAVDVGSTTIGVSCIDLESFEEICAFSFGNPQVRYGADVITRIKHCVDEPEMLNTLSEILTDALKKQLMDCLLDDYGYITEICYSGNTTMMHILRGLSVAGLAAAPFSPVSLDYFETELSCESEFYQNNFEGNVKEIYLPGFSAFVGADILSGAEYLNMGEGEKYDLLVDLGTNGELLLLNKDYGFATSTACGPVFDHGVTGAVYGSESIHAIAACVKRGLIDKTGLIREPFFDKGIELDHGFVIRQEQVRRFQMAKAAIYAGIICLMRKSDIDFADIRNVYISGGLGFYLDKRDAFITKMLPVEFKDKIVVSGNTSLEGAKRFLTARDRDVLRSNYLKLKGRTESFELAGFDEFNDIYIDSMGM